MSNSFKIYPTYISCGDEIFLGDASPPPGYGPVDFYTSQKTNIFLRTVCAFLILVYGKKSFLSKESDTLRSYSIYFAYDVGIMSCTKCMKYK